MPNALIADWLVKPITNRKRWGFGLCFLYLRNVKGFGAVHAVTIDPGDQLSEQTGGALEMEPQTPLSADCVAIACRAMVHRIYCELELNLRSEPLMRHWFKHNGERQKSG